MNGNQPRVQGPEADQFRKELETDIAFAAKTGSVIDVPGEWPEA